MDKATIIILNWNNWQDTLECLKSISRLQVAGCRLQVVVVDNASTDGSVKRLRDLEKKKFRNIERERSISLKTIFNEQNLGFAEGNNAGIRYALDHGSDYVILLNNDTLVDKSLVSQLVKVMKGNQDIGILGPKIYFAPGFEFHQDRYSKGERGKVIWYAGGKIDWKNVYCSHRGVDEVDKGQYDKQRLTDFATGCCMMIRKEVFKRTGFLDEKYFLYLEDVDFCLRARKRGFKVVYTPKAYLWHKNAASSEKPGSKTHVYYQTRNRLYFGLKYAPLKSKLALARESLRFILKDGVKKRASLDFYTGKLGRTSSFFNKTKKRAVFK